MAGFEGEADIFSDGGARDFLTVAGGHRDE